MDSNILVILQSWWNDSWIMQIFNIDLGLVFDPQQEKEASQNNIEIDYLVLQIFKNYLACGSRWTYTSSTPSNNSTPSLTSRIPNSTPNSLPCPYCFPTSTNGWRLGRHQVMWRLLCWCFQGSRSTFFGVYLLFFWAVEGSLAPYPSQGISFCCELCFCIGYKSFELVFGQPAKMFGVFMEWFKPRFPRSIWAYFNW